MSLSPARSFRGSRDTGPPRSTGCLWTQCSGTAGRTSNPSLSTWARARRRRSGRTPRSSFSVSRRSRQVRAGREHALPPPRTALLRHAPDPDLILSQGSCSQSRTGAPTCRRGWLCLRVQGGQLVRATGSCRCAHHSAPASLPPPALAHESLALCAFAHGSLFFWCGCAGVAGGGVSCADARRTGVGRFVGHGDGAGRGWRNDAAAWDAGGPVGHCQLEQPGRGSEIGQLRRTLTHGEADARLGSSPLYVFLAVDRNPNVP